MQKTELTSAASGISGTPIPYNNEVIVLDSDTEDSDEAGRDHDADGSGGGCTSDDMTSTEHPIDEQGDLQLVVTAGPRIRQIFRVDSRALARSSEFWHHLINTSDDAPPTSKARVEVDTGPQYTFTSLQALLSQPDPPALAPAAEMSTSTRMTGSMFAWPDSPDTSSRPATSQWMSNHQSLGGQMPAGSSSQAPQTSSASPTTPASPFSNMMVSPFASAGHNQADIFSSVAAVPFVLPGTPVTTTTMTTTTTPSVSGAVSGMSNPFQATETSRTIHLDLAEYRAHVACLGTLLYAAHGRLDRVPTQPTLREFCSLVVLANRCDMVPIMRGHIHTWLHTAVMADDDDDDLGGLNGRVKGSGSGSNSGHSGGNGVQSPGIPPGLFTRLRIFWEVGSQTEFQRTLAMLAWHTQMDGSGGLACNQLNSRLPRSIVREEVVAVTGVADNVSSHRKRIITLALDLLHRRIQLLQGPMSGSKMPRDPSDSTITACDANGESCSCAVGKRAGRDCDAYYYGLLVQELGRKRVDPHRLPVPAAVRKSPHALCAILEHVHDAIDERTQPLQSRFLNGHGHCNPLSPMIVQLKSLRDEDTADLTEIQRKHFQEQSLKMGKKYWGI